MDINYQNKILAAALYNYEKFIERNIKNTYNRDVASFLKNDLKLTQELREMYEEQLEKNNQ